MKLLLSYIFLLLSFSCLFVVCSEEVLDKVNVMFWACITGIAVCLVDKQLKKKECK